MQEIMFSVAVITYNQEKYISQTLDSILCQEHNYKYEIVIGEDCSALLLKFLGQNVIFS